jgi:hypothetical protein
VQLYLEIGLLIRIRDMLICAVERGPRGNLTAVWISATVANRSMQPGSCMGP